MGEDFSGADSAKLLDKLNKGERKELEKYVFALNYMKISNRYFLKGRDRMSDDECRKFYESRVEPYTRTLKTRLEKPLQTD